MRATVRAIPRVPAARVSTLQIEVARRGENHRSLDGENTLVAENCVEMGSPRERNRAHGFYHQTQPSLDVGKRLPSLVQRDAPRERSRSCDPNAAFRQAYRLNADRLAVHLLGYLLCRRRSLPFSQLRPPDRFRGGVSAMSVQLLRPPQKQPQQCAYRR